MGQKYKRSFIEIKMFPKKNHLINHAKNHFLNIYTGRLFKKKVKLNFKVLKN